MSLSLSGRGALVTGAARGLGRAMADALEAAGAGVKSVDLADGVDLSTLTAERAAELVASARDELGELSILVNNAGAISRAPAEDTGAGDWHRIIALNLTAPFLLSQAFARGRLDAGGGSIVNVVSMNAFHGGMTVPAYTASKTGLLGLTRALANEWTGRGVRVNAVAPGWMETELTAALREDGERFDALSARIPAGRWGRPEDVGGAVVFLASEASAYVSGAVLPIDGGYLVR